MILAFDTSCDDTAVACFINCSAYSNVVSSQNEVHARYGGVLPELAARKHLENIGFLTKEALEKANVRLSGIEYIAVTVGPGLPPALLVGVAFAKGIAYSLDLPIIPVNHIEGHMFAPFFCRDMEFPFVALVVSGGHTHLFRVDGVGRYKLLGKTLDDAVGEAFDKVARMLDLGYPGGPVIDRLSKLGNPEAFRIPAGLESKKTLNFSFSGPKTAVKNLVKKMGSLSITEIRDIAASFQKSAIDILIKRSIEACRREKVNLLVISGGVSANSYLREAFPKRAEEASIRVLLPSREMTTDNALMIAFAASLVKDRATRDYLSIDADPSYRIY